MTSVALVTGAAGGIGAAAARRLGRDGFALAIHDIDPGRAGALADELVAAGVSARPYVGDISDTACLRALAGEIEGGFGPIELLVNNAGIGGDRGGIETTTPESLERMLAVHVAGPVFLTQAVVAHMKIRRRGRIVMMSSTRGVAGAPYGVAYNAAKGAIVSITKGWAKEFAPWGITVNAVAPGYVRTAMAGADDAAVRAGKIAAVPLGREADADEIAACIAFLAGKDAGYLTGQIVGVNGGLVI